ncbi:MAG: hypothetical protein WBX25_11070 [Rhodomicrobium sp.]
MLTCKKLTAFTAAIMTVSVPLLTVSANANTLHHTPAAYSVMRVEVYNSRVHKRYARRNRGLVYGQGYMNCINSGHPADFCQAVHRDFR